MKKIMFTLVAVLLLAVIGSLVAQTASTNMVFIKGGTFSMGSPRVEWQEANKDILDLIEYDELQHSVTVSSFYLSKYAVTVREWCDVMEDYDPYFYEGDNWPMEQVSWYDAVEYCNKLNQREGLTPAYTIDKSWKDPNNQHEEAWGNWLVTWNRKANGYRLPTEAEWEYACRAGTTTSFNAGNNITTRQANYDGSFSYNENAEGMDRGKTTPVGGLRRTPGLIRHARECVGVVVGLVWRLSARDAD